MKNSNQSIYLIILQIFSIFVGVISTFYIAGNIDPKYYSLIGIYNIISILSIVFSSTGVETYAIRNILSFLESNKTEKIKKLISISIFSRLFFSLIILVPLFIYSYYMSVYKFDNNYFNLFMIMSLVSVIRTLNDSSNLLLKSFNKYLLSAFSLYSINIFGKIIAIYFFTLYGIEVYLYILFGLPFFVNILTFYSLKNYLNFTYFFDFKTMFYYIKKSKSFILSSYSSYIYNNLDQLLISLLLKPENLGVFSLGKNLWNISKNFIENIFDPMTQKFVEEKNNLQKLKFRFFKIKKFKNNLFKISIILLIPFSFMIDDIVFLLKIEKYQNIEIFIFCILISSITYLYSKLLLNFSTLCYKPIYHLKINLISALTSLIFLLLFINLNFSFVFCYITISYFILIIYLKKLFHNYGFNIHK